jgi:hypothetical protein
MIIQMKKLDDRIKDVSRSGEGARDYLTFALQEGTLVVSSLDDEVMYTVLSTKCFEKRENITGLYFESEINAGCSNKILINYTNINITNNATHTGNFDLWIENIGYLEKPLLTVG